MAGHNSDNGVSDERKRQGDVPKITIDFFLTKRCGRRYFTKFY